MNLVRKLLCSMRQAFSKKESLSGVVSAESRDMKHGSGKPTGGLVL